MPTFLLPSARKEESMPKLTNKCAICGTPILKSATICAKCVSDKEARQREIDSQMEVYNVRLQSAFLWEKRRYEIAKDILSTMFYRPENQSSTVEADVDYAVEVADVLIEKLKKGE